MVLFQCPVAGALTIILGVKRFGFYLIYVIFMSLVIGLITDWIL